MAIDREKLLETIRAAVKSTGGTRIGMDKFLATASLKSGDIYRHFPGWRQALLAAGCNPTSHNDHVDTSHLLSDWASCAARLSRIPTWHEYKIRGKHGLSTFTRRFGSWHKVPEAFRTYAAKRPRYKRLLKTLTPAIDAPRRRYRGGPRVAFPHLKPGSRFHDRPACGIPIDFGPLRHAPTNEFGVIFLFALLAEKLGFMIEGFQAAFPDCLAKRLTAPGAWQHVTIEFEFESRSFHHHHHPVDGCDLIVCWEHNWAECPKPLEVIALKDELRRLSPDTVKKINHDPVQIDE